PIMRRQKSGTIVTIGSIAGLMGLPFQGFYSASKHALEGLMESLRYEVKPWGINVVMVNPGDFSTGFTANRLLVKNASNSESGKALNTTLSVIESDEKSGLKSEILARKVASIVTMKRPASRYIVASPEQRLAVCLKRLLPPKWFFRVLAQHYKVKGI
ncbi:MAG TPA: SDR family NAD(P)-dependent oxidoreductase, partial [Bacteroidales bacterium]|nr:SDR family NAD(P)-dependent oxidoreductase [Bacteroidales bacterium]